METGQPNKIQDRLQGILRRLNREQLRNRVSKWQRLVFSASSRFSFDSFTSSGSQRANSNVEQVTNDEVVGKKLKEDIISSCGSKQPCALTSGNVEETNENDVNIEEEIMDGNCHEIKLLTTPVESLTPRNKSPVQQWIDSLPSDEPVRKDEEPPPIPQAEAQDSEVESFTLGAEAPGLVCPRPYPSVQISNACGGSDAGSHCSSMESLLEARKPDPEELLLELGFGGSEEPDSLSRIPARFLQPSNLKGVAINDFLRHQKLLVHTFQSGFSGYRGLTGPSHAMPSVIVGKIMDRLREAEVGRCAGEVPRLGSSPRLAKIANNIINKIKTVKEVSVLSPDNRKWYESQGDKSPEPTNKRIIIGPQAYTFSKDGNLIESPSSLLRPGSSDVSRTESALGEETILLEELVEHGPAEMKNNLTESSEDETEEDERNIKVWTIEGNNDKSARIEMTKTEPDFKPNDLSLKTDKNISSEQLALEYKNMALLVSHLSGSETGVDIGTEENFCRLTPDERKCLVISLIESALSTYHKRLRELDLRSHLKDLLSGQLHKVTDLLDEAQSPSLVTLIKQVTSLLRHQESLRRELQMHEAQSSMSYEDSVS